MRDALAGRLAYMLLDRPMQIVTPTVDGDLLAVLARGDVVLTPGELQRRMGRYSISGIRKALTRLTAQGIVTAETRPHATLYQLNRRHLAADAIVALASQREELLGRLSRALEDLDPAPGLRRVVRLRCPRPDAHHQRHRPVPRQARRHRRGAARPVGRFYLRPRWRSKCVDRQRHPRARDEPQRGTQRTRAKRPGAGLHPRRRDPPLRLAILLASPDRGQLDDDRTLADTLGTR